MKSEKPARRVEVQIVLELTDEELFDLAESLDGRNLELKNSDVFYHLRRALSHQIRTIALREKFRKVEVRALCAEGPT